jgi:hypothetical protein
MNFIHKISTDNDFPSNDDSCIIPSHYKGGAECLYTKCSKRKSMN